MNLPSDDSEVFGGEGAARPPGRWSHVTWSIKDIVVGATAILLLFFLLAVAIAYPVIEIYGEDSVEVLAVQILTAALWDAGIIAIVYSLARRKGGSWRDLGLRLPLRGLAHGNEPLAFIGLVATGYVGAIAVVQIYALVLKVIGLDDLLPGQQLPGTLYDYQWVLIGFAIVGTTIVPFAEELFFRGFFFAGLRPKLPFVLAALISGFFFSLAHADPGLIIPFTGVGFILAYMYERTGSLYASIGVHMLFNSVSFLVLIFVPEAR